MKQLHMHNHKKRKRKKYELQMIGGQSTVDTSVNDAYKLCRRGSIIFSTIF